MGGIAGEIEIGELDGAFREVGPRTGEAVRARSIAREGGRRAVGDVLRLQWGRSRRVWEARRLGNSTARPHNARVSRPACLFHRPLTPHFRPVSKHDERVR